MERPLNATVPQPSDRHVLDLREPASSRFREGRRVLRKLACVRLGPVFMASRRGDYFTDYVESIRLGEKIACAILEEQAAGYPEDLSVTFTSFDRAEDGHAPGASPPPLSHRSKATMSPVPAPSSAGFCRPLGISVPQLTL